MELRDRQTYNMRKYFHNKIDQNCIIREIVKADENLTPLNLSQKEDLIEAMIRTRNEEKIERWRSKAIHGRSFKELNSDEVDKKMSCEGLRMGSLYAETRDS